MHTGVRGALHKHNNFPRRYLRVVRTSRVLTKLPKYIKNSRHQKQEYFYNITTEVRNKLETTSTSVLEIKFSFMRIIDKRNISATFSSFLWMFCGATEQSLPNDLQVNVSTYYVPTRSICVLFLRR